MVPTRQLTRRKKKTLRYCLFSLQGCFFLNFVFNFSFRLFCSEQDEQRLVSRLVNQISSEETDTLFRIYSTARAHFSQGGMRRIEFTLVPLMFRYLSLARAVFAQGVSVDGEEPKVGKA
jgi:hypothetical protein